MSDEFVKDSKNFVHLAALALRGDPSAIRTYLIRTVRESLKGDPAFAHALREVVASAPDRPDEMMAPSTLRRADQPISRVEANVQGAEGLLRIEDPVQLRHSPVYTDGVATRLMELVREHAEPQLLHRHGLTPTRTVVLAGPPGVGKTMAARWVASELGWPLMILDLSNVMSRYLGATGANLKRALEYARARPCVLFLDELDAIAKRRDDNADIGELKRLVTVLLQELDEWPEGRLLMAATNHAQLLDTAIWRRFETRIELGRPTLVELKALMASIASGARDLPSAWITVLPVLMEGTSHAEMERVLLRLRRQVALNPSSSPVDALKDVVEEALLEAPRARRQTVALALAEHTKLSDRTISAMTSVSRDKLRASRDTNDKRSSK